MFIIAGLGNPTLQYEGTRHNAGFDVIDTLAGKYNISVDGRKNRALIGKGIIEGKKVILAKPQTYMNLSGESLGGLVDYYKVDEESEFLVVYDDMKNIISHLGTEVFPRIKVGVGEKPKKYDLADYVLSRFSKEERAIMEEGCQKAVEAVEMILRGEMEEAMNKFNRKVKPKEA